MRGRELRVNVGAGGRGGAQVGGGAHALQHGLREAVDLVEICAHALGHDLAGDVDHVGVAHAAAVDDIGHLHAGAKFVGLDLDGEDRGVRALHVIEHQRGHGSDRAGRKRLQDEGVPRAADAVEFRDDGRGDLHARLVGDEGDLLRGPDVQTGGDGVARACGVLGREGDQAEIEDGLAHSLKHGVRRLLGRGCNSSLGSSFRSRSGRIFLSRSLHVVILR